MPRPIIPGVAEARFRAVRDGNERITVLHYRLPSGNPTPEAIGRLAGELAAGQHLARRIIDPCAIGTFMDQVQVTDLSVANGAQSVVDINYGGTGGSQVLPANVAAVISKRTAMSGRSKRGRLFLYDLSEDFFNGSTINHAVADPLLAPLLPLLVAVVGTDLWEPVVASSTLLSAERITSVALREVAATQRRRLPGHGS